MPAKKKDAAGGTAKEKTPNQTPEGAASPEATQELTSDATGAKSDAQEAEAPATAQAAPESEASVTAQPPAEAASERQPRVSQIVLYVMPNGSIRPAIIVDYERYLVGAHAGFATVEKRCNLQVFTDGSNDQNALFSSGFNERVATGLLWASNAPYSEAHEAGTWHWAD